MPATTLEGALVELLKNSPDLTGVIGSGDDARVWPARIPQDADKNEDGHARPSMSFLLINAERVSAFGSDTGLTRSRFQFSCWADAYDDARLMANGLRKTLQRYRDTTGAGGIVIQDCFLIGETMTFDETVASHGVLVDYEVIWEEGI